jgi:hypothetical protein
MSAYAITIAFPGSWRSKKKQAPWMSELSAVWRGVRSDGKSALAARKNFPKRPHNFKNPHKFTLATAVVADAFCEFHRAKGHTTK